MSENQWDLACQPTAATTDLDFGSDKECCDADELQLSLADVADTWQISVDKVHRDMERLTPQSIYLAHLQSFYQANVGSPVALNPLPPVVVKVNLWSELMQVL